MRRRLPPNVERNVVKGHTYLSYRVGKGPRTKLPDDPSSVHSRRPMPLQLPARSKRGPRFPPTRRDQLERSSRHILEVTLLLPWGVEANKAIEAEWT